MQQNEKHFTQKNILFMGSPNSGKSTLCGCLVCHDDMRYVELTANRLFQDVEEHLRPSKQLQILEAYRHCSHKTNYPERARKIQIAIHHKSDENKKEILTFMDVSTHKKKIDCFIKACFLADIAVLVIDVTENIFEKEIENLDSTLNNQLRIAKSVGIPHMIVCLNMCDKAQQLHSRFKEIVSCLDPKLRKLGWKNVPYIPVSSVDFGLNILHNSGIFSFYKGESLWNTLKTLEISKDSLKLQDKPLKMAAVDVFRIGGVGTVIIARIESGILREADIIEVYPKPNKSWVVKSLEIAFNSIKHATVGDFVGIALKGCRIYDVKNSNIFNKQNERLSPLDVESFEATAKIIKTPESNEIRVGYTCKMHFMTYRYLCKIEEIMSARTENNVVKAYPPSVKAGQVIQTRIRLIRRARKFAPLELYSENPRLGRVLLVDRNMLIGVANVTKLNFSKTSFDED